MQFTITDHDIEFINQLLEARRQRQRVQRLAGFRATGRAVGRMRHAAFWRRVYRASRVSLAVFTRGVARGLSGR
jgi:hypothetical protein